MKLLNARMQSEKEAELRLLGQELASKNEALRILEMSSTNSQQLNEEQKRFLADAARSEHLQKKLNEQKTELMKLNERLTEFQNLAEELTNQKRELEDRLRDYDQIKDERTRLAASLEENRKLLSHYSELEAEHHRLQVVIKDKELERDRHQERVQHLSQELERTLHKADADAQLSNRVKCELQQKDQELHGIRAAYTKLEEENQKLYNHVDYAEKQIVMAKDAINAKQVLPLHCDFV